MIGAVHTMKDWGCSHSSVRNLYRLSPVTDAQGQPNPPARHDLIGVRCLECWSIDYLDGKGFVEPPGTTPGRVWPEVRS